MFKLLSTAVLGASVTLTGSSAAFACGGCCGCAPTASAGCGAAVAPAPPNGGTTGAPLPPDQVSQRQTYRSYSYDPSAPTYRAPMMRRAAPSYSKQFSADRKIRGLVN